MINLLSGGAFSEAVNKGYDKAFFGLLTSPLRGKNPQHAIDRGLPWAADNDCFNRYDPLSIYDMLKRYKGLQGCKFINAPDVVGNHKATLKRFQVWERLIHNMGYPVAFTLQNGCVVEEVPWKKCEAIFIGGDTQFKYTSEVARIVTEANKRGIWVHMGRVNTQGRITYSRNIGCTSFDGTGYSIYPPLIKALWAFHTGSIQQPFLFNM